MNQPAFVAVVAVVEFDVGYVDFAFVGVVFAVVAFVEVEVDAVAFVEFEVVGVVELAIAVIDCY
jgi:hypothetical protein